MLVVMLVMVVVMVMSSPSNFRTSAGLVIFPAQYRTSKIDQILVIIQLFVGRSVQVFGYDFTPRGSRCWSVKTESFQRLWWVICHWNDLLTFFVILHNIMKKLVSQFFQIYISVFNRSFVKITIFLRNPNWMWKCLEMFSKTRSSLPPQSSLSHEFREK